MTPREPDRIGQPQESAPSWEGLSDELTPNVNPEMSADLDLGIFDPPRFSTALGRLGKYDVIEVVGHGGMGIVVRAIDPDLGRTVAIKLLNRRLASNSTARRRFQREAKAAAAVNHPNVLTIHSVEEHRGTPFLVMEFVPGKSLKEYISIRGTIEPLEALRLGTQIAQGLAAAHAQGVIHRDVKPGNVMLHEGATRVRLTDFGLARATFDIAELTSAGVAIGTPAYMAPEQVRGETVDGRADLFSLGCVFYAMLTGSSPFTAKSHAETIHRILNTVPPPLTDRIPPVPPLLCEVVEKLLKKDPNERIQSAHEVAEMLQRFQNEVNRAKTDEMAQVLSKPMPATKSATPREGSVSTVPHTTPRAGLGPWLVIGGLLALGVGGWGLWERFSGLLDGAREAANGSTESVRPVEPVQAPPPGTALLSELTVAQDGSGRFRTVSDALSLAADGATITVLDDATYTETLVLAERPHGVTLVAPRRAVLRAPATGDRTIVRLRHVRGVTLRGFRLECESGSKGQAILVTGATSATLEELDLRPRPEALGSAMVRCDAQGAEANLVIRRCRLMLPSRGTGVWLDGRDPPSSVEIVDNRFVGPLSQIVVFGGCRQLRIAGNVFDGGMNAINLSLARWLPETRVEITNNTFVRTKFWLGLLETFKSTQPTSPVVGIVGNNLILGGERIQASETQIDVALDQWRFVANWWERDTTTLPTAHRDGRVAESVESLPVPERTDPDATDFLRPAPGSPLETSGAGGDLPSYVGAKSPK